MDASGKTYVESILPVLEPWMDGEKPLYRYDYQMENGKVQMVIEWEKQDPIRRLEEIKRQSMAENPAIFHLEIYQQEKERENFIKVKTRKRWIKLKRETGDVFARRHDFFLFLFIR